MGKLKPSNNHINRSRSFAGNRYNFHSTISAEEQAQIAEAIDNASDNTELNKNIEITEAKSIGTLSPIKTIDIPLEELRPAPEEWNYFPLPCLEVLKDIARSIYSQGQLSPAIVWECKNDKYTILGGHTRYKILQFLKEQYPDEAERFSTMRCHVYGEHQINDDIAQYLIITNNMTQRARESTSIMVKSIVKAFELQKSITSRIWGEKQERSNEIVAKNFGIGSRSVDRLYRLRTLISVIMDMLDNAQITQSTALKIATLPKDVQVMMYDLEYPLHRKITPDMLNRLQNVRNKSEVNDIFSEKLYYISHKKILIDVPVPKDFEKISIAASSDDMEIIRTELKNISDKLSEESKLILLKILGYM